MTLSGTGVIPPDVDLETAKKASKQYRPKIGIEPPLEAAKKFVPARGYQRDVMLAGYIVRLLLESDEVEGTIDDVVYPDYTGRTLASIVDGVGHLAPGQNFRGKEVQGIVKSLCMTGLIDFVVEPLFQQRCRYIYFVKGFGGKYSHTRMSATWTVEDVNKYSRSPEQSAWIKRSTK